MKKYINSLFAIFAALVIFTGCDEEDGRITFDGAFIEFDVATQSIAENSTSIVRIPVNNAGPTSGSDITVNYSTEGSTAVEGVDFEILAGGQLGQVIIPAGSNTGIIQLRMIDNLMSEGNLVLNLKLASNSANISSGRGEVGLASSLTIIDDDCPIDLSEYEGEYSMAVVGAPGQAFDGFDLCEAASRDCSGPVTLVADASDPLGLTAIIQHPSIGGEYKIEFVTCAQETKVVQPMTSFFGVAAWQMQQGQINGSYTASTIEIAGVLGTNGEFIITLTRN